MPFRQPERQFGKRYAESNRVWVMLLEFAAS